jgi:TPP-dependent pyruvate/acetoin dehydrogenase alpha subunit
MNQGMLVESMNLASVWNLPVLFVCKDDGWAITTQSAKVTGGNLNERARGLGIPAVEVDGCDVSAVWEAAQRAIEHALPVRGRPSCMLAACISKATS